MASLCGTAAALRQKKSLCRESHIIINQTLPALNNIYTCRCLKDSSHPSHYLFELMSSKKCYRSIETRTTRFIWLSTWLSHFNVLVNAECGVRMKLTMTTLHFFGFSLMWPRCRNHIGSVGESMVSGMSKTVPGSYHLRISSVVGRSWKARFISVRKMMGTEYSSMLDIPS